MGLEEIKYIKSGQARLDRENEKKNKPYRIPMVSKKQLAKIAAKKKDIETGEDPGLIWKIHRRQEMTGYCQCGCGAKDQKADNKFFGFCLCHIFPQRLFKSVQYHPKNYVERNYWNGCHSNMDNKSMDLWPQMADWEDIKNKFWILSPLLSRVERGKKFYNHLLRLVTEN